MITLTLIPRVPSKKDDRALWSSMPYCCGQLNKAQDIRCVGDICGAFMIATYSHGVCGLLPSAAEQVQKIPAPSNKCCACSQPCPDKHERGSDVALCALAGECRYQFDVAK